MRSLLVFSYINCMSLLSHESQGTELSALQCRFVAEPFLQIPPKIGPITVYPVNGPNRVPKYDIYYLLNPRGSRRWICLWWLIHKRLLDFSVFIHLCIHSWDRPHVSQADLNLPMSLRMTLNFWCSYLYLPSAGILDDCQHTEFLWCFHLNPQPHACWTSILPGKRKKKKPLIDF